MKNKQVAYEKLFEMSRNDYYTTGNLCHQNFNKLIGIDLSRQKSTTIPQQINFTGKLEQNDGATIFLIAETILKFYLDSLIVTK